MQYARLIGSGIEMETLSYIIFCHFIKDIICNMWSSSALYRVIPDQYDSFDEYNKWHVKDVTNTLTMKVCLYFSTNLIISQPCLQNILTLVVNGWILLELNAFELEVKSETPSFEWIVESENPSKVRLSLVRETEGRPQWRVGAAGRLLRQSPPPPWSRTMSWNSPWRGTRRLEGVQTMILFWKIILRLCQVSSFLPMENGLPAVVQTSLSKYGVSRGLDYNVTGMVHWMTGVII